MQVWLTIMQLLALGTAGHRWLQYECKIDNVHLQKIKLFEIFDAAVWPLHCTQFTPRSLTWHIQENIRTLGSNLLACGRHPNAIKTAHICKFEHPYPPYYTSSA